MRAAITARAMTPTAINAVSRLSLRLTDRLEKYWFQRLIRFMGRASLVDERVAAMLLSAKGSGY